MPQAIPFAAGVAAGLGAASATYVLLGTGALTLTTAMSTAGAISKAFALGSMTGSLVVGTVQARHQQNRAQSKARAACEAAQSDRALMVRNPIQPRRVIYGENVVSGVTACC